MDLEGIVLSEINQTEQDKYKYLWNNIYSTYIFHYMWNLKKKKKTRQAKQNRYKFIHTEKLVVASSVQFSCSVVSESLRSHGLQHARPLCPSPTPRVYSNSCPLSRWCHPTISSSVIPFSSRLQCFQASGSFPMSQFLASGGQSIGVSASTSVLPTNIQVVARGEFILK